MRKRIFEPGTCRAFSGMAALVVFLLPPFHSVSAQPVVPATDQFLSVNVQQVSTTETTGQQLVRLDLRVHNPTADTLHAVDLLADFADQLGPAFIEIPHHGLIIGSEQVAPQVRRRLDQSASTSLLRRPLLLPPGGSFRMRLPLLVAPEMASDPTTLTVQVDMNASTSEGTEIIDRSDNGTETHSSNPLFAGLSGGFDDPTPLYGEFPMLLTGPASVDFSATGLAFDTWLTDRGGFRVALPDGCGPATYEQTVSATEDGAEVEFEYLDQCGHRFTQRASYRGSSVTGQLLGGSVSVSPIALYNYRSAVPQTLVALPFCEIGFGVAPLTVAPPVPLDIPLVERFPEPVVSGLPYDNETIR